MKFYQLKSLILFLLVFPFGFSQTPLPPSTGYPQSLDMEHFFVERSMRFNSGWDLDYTSDYTTLTEQFINSGNILFHTSTQQLLDSILHRLASNESYQIFHFRSNQVVPFSNAQGEIFISTGLIAKVNSIDELAFFIAREISRIERECFPIPQLHRTISYEEKLTSFTKGDLTNDIILDSMGLQLILRHGFKKEQINHALDILKQVHLSFSELEIRFDYFNNDHLAIPQSFYTISEQEDYILNYKSEEVRELEKTIEKRKLQLFKNVGSIVYVKKIPLPPVLKEIQEYARHEFVIQDILQGNYVRSVYSIFALESLYGASHGTNRLKAHTWYGFSLSKLDAFRYSANLNYTNFGEKNAAFFLAMNRSNASTIVAITLRILRDLRNTYPEDAQIEHLWNDLTRRISSNFRFNLKQFSTTSTKEILKNAPSLLSDSTFQIYAISDIVSDSSFWSDCTQKPPPFVLDKMDRIVIYPCLTILRKTDQDTIKSNERIAKLTNGIINLNEHFRVGDFTSLSVQDQSTVKQVFSQLYAQTDYSYNIPVMNTEDLLEMNSYGEYIMFPFFLTEFKIRPKKYYLASIFLVTIPFVIPDMLLKSYHSSYGMILVERSTGKLVKSEYHDFNEPLSVKLMLNRIYNSLYEINKKVE